MSLVVITTPGDVIPLEKAGGATYIVRSDSIFRGGRRAVAFGRGRWGRNHLLICKKWSGKSLGILIGNFDWEYIYIWICGYLGIHTLMISNPLMMAYPLIVRWHIWYLGILIGNIFGTFDNHLGMIDWLSPNDND